MNKALLLIFTRNPELGKVKTRLAATVGDQTALDIYIFLLEHTIAITKNLPLTKHVYYSEKVRANDLWDRENFEKRQQIGSDLGERMHNAFIDGFREGFERIIIIGSDMYDLDADEIMEAFRALANHDFVIGPATDGGYYLLGMKSIKHVLFRNKHWGYDTVLNDTLGDLSDERVQLLSEKNDVDYYDDIKDIEAFQPFLKNLNSTSTK